jgi:CRISPR-associated protein Cmr3
MMKTWLIEPHDSFIARDGRPFGLFAGVRANSLPFPFPSTITGGVRTRDGIDSRGVFDSDKANLDRVKELQVRGPLLAEVDRDGNVTEWYAHAPADALLLDVAESDQNRAKVCRLVPTALPLGAHANMPDDLMPLFQTRIDKSKPHGYAPRFWRWHRFKDWLTNPKDVTVEDLHSFGINGLAQDQRSHVAIESETQASEQGFLFQTQGLEFTKPKLAQKLESASRLALVLSTDAAGLDHCVASLGGERRLVSWREFRGVEDIFNSECPSEIADAIVADKACRVVLLTPAYFEAGWKPAWVIKQGNVTLKSAAIGRAQVISGWDFEIKKPKPSRRLVPGGSIFYFKLGGSECEIRDWVKATWMSCISDDDAKHVMTPRRDGFGLAALGTWKEGKDAA